MEKQIAMKCNITSFLKGLSTVLRSVLFYDRVMGIKQNHTCFLS